MKGKFKDREVFIGLDWPVLAGRSEVWVTAIILVPIILLWSLVLPGNVVLPIAGIINYSIAVGGLLLTGGNLYRMIVLGIIYTPLYLYGATYLAPILTNLGKQTGAVDFKGASMITWSSIEGPEFRILFAEAFNTNFLAIVGVIIFIGLFYWTYKIMINEKVPSQRYVEEGK